MVNHDGRWRMSTFGPAGRDVIIGHDWGATAATGLSALPDGNARAPE